MLGLVLFAAATATDVDRKTAMCGDQHGAGALGEQICASDDHINAYNELNKVWVKTLKAVDELQRDHFRDGKFNARAELLKAQRAWLLYRDSTCQFIYDSEDSGSTVMHRLIRRLAWQD